MFPKPCLQILILLIAYNACCLQVLSQTISKEEVLLNKDNLRRPLSLVDKTWPGLQQYKPQYQPVSNVKHNILPVPNNPAVVSSATACRDSSFKKNFEATDWAYVYTCSEKTNSGGILLGGYGLDKATIPITPNYAMVTKFDSMGNHLWSKQIQSYVETYVGIYQLKEFSDGSIIIAGDHDNKLNFTPPNYAEMFVAKLSATGDLVWLKTYRTLIVNSCTSTNIFNPNISEGANGDVLITATAWNCPYPKQLVTFKLNSNGVLQWKYAFQPPYNDGYGVAAFYEGSYVTIINRTNDDGATPGGAIHTDLIKLDYATGALISFKGWKVDEPYPASFYNSFVNTVAAVKLDNGNYCVYGVAFGSYNYTLNDTTPHFSVLEFNSNYDFVNGYVIKTPLLTNVYTDRIKVNRKKQIIYSVNEDLGYPDLNTYAGTITGDRIVHQRKNEFRNQEVFYDNFETFGDGSYVVIKNLATIGQSNFTLEYSKLHNSDTGSICLGVPAAFSYIEPMQYIPHTFSWVSINPNPFNETSNQNNVSVPFSYSAAARCIQIAVCDTLKIHGQGTICNYLQDIFFTAFKNPSCGAVVNWSLPATVVQQMDILNDSSVKIKLNQPWQGWLYASIETSCGIIKDSVFILTGIAPGPVNAGADKQICPGNSVTLHAGTGYASYAWSNGSTDSVITVSVPGTYFIDVTDACGQFSSDTVIVTAAPPIAFSAGPDRIKCNADTLQLNSTAGFLNYSWSPNYNINSLSAQNVIVNPFTDTVYYVKAEKTPGCFAFDTVKIKVNHSLPVNLGRDTSICTGAAVILNAGAGFANYLWNNGNTGQQITVTTNGTYIVVATDANNCRSTDTFNLVSVYALPLVTLNHNPDLCAGSARILDAGNFSNYLWQDGSVNRTFTATGPGIYYVTVTDNDGCSGSDTAKIITLVQLVKNFLPADTAICTYETLKLQVTQNFAAYLWSNNSTGSSIAVTQPGSYWLQVTDSKNCVSRDSITVSLKQQCGKGLYVPTAFTPNGDGRNDQLRAFLLGSIQKFEFRIYNRYGQQVFFTNDVADGWDGKVGGEKQNTGSFVWTCKYQLAGEPEVNERGISTLLR